MIWPGVTGRPASPTSSLARPDIPGWKQVRAGRLVPAPGRQSAGLQPATRHGTRHTSFLQSHSLYRGRGVCGPEVPAERSQHPLLLLAGLAVDTTADS